MYLCGLQKLSMVDYPDKLAATVFAGGCDLRCPFCHNALLVTRLAESPVLPEAEVLEFLSRRKGLLDGVVLSGGEPLLQPDAADFLEKVRALGFAVKLDTNGCHPEALADILERGLADYVAMDIKNAPSLYAQTCGGIDRLSQVRESAALLLGGDVDYEFRTTVCAPLHTQEAMVEIGQWLQGAKRYFLQPFVDPGALLGSGVTPLSHEAVSALRCSVLPYIPSTQIRGE